MAEKEVGQVQVKLVVELDEASASRAGRKARDTAQREMGGGYGGGPGVPPGGGAGVPAGVPPPLQQVRYAASIARLSGGRQAQANVFALAQGGYEPGSGPYYSTGTTANLMQAGISEAATRAADARERRFSASMDAAEFAAFREAEAAAAQAHERHRARQHSIAKQNRSRSEAFDAALGSIDKEAMDLSALEAGARMERRLGGRTEMEERRLATLRARPLSRQLYDAGQQQVMSTGMLMQLMFGGWELSQVYAAATAGRYGAIGGNPAASLAAEMMTQQMVRRGPFGSIAGMMVDPGGHALAAMEFGVERSKATAARMTGGLEFSQAGIMLSRAAETSGLRGTAAELAGVETRRLASGESVRAQATAQAQRIAEERDLALREYAAQLQARESVWRRHGYAMAFTGVAGLATSLLWDPGSYSDRSGEINQGASARQYSLSRQMREQLADVDRAASEAGRKIIETAIQSIEESIAAQGLEMARSRGDVRGMRASASRLASLQRHRIDQEAVGLPSEVARGLRDQQATGELATQRNINEFERRRNQESAENRAAFANAIWEMYQRNRDAQLTTEGYRLALAGGGTAQEQIAFARTTTLRRTGNAAAAGLAGAITSRDIGIQDSLLQSEGRQLDSMLNLRPLDAAAEAIIGETNAQLAVTGDPGRRELIRANAEKRIRLIGQGQLQLQSSGTGSVFQTAQGGSPFSPESFIGQLGGQPPGVAAAPELKDILNVLRTKFDELIGIFR